MGVTAANEQAPDLPQRQASPQRAFRNIWRDSFARYSQPQSREMVKLQGAARIAAREYTAKKYILFEI